ncbi:hypothetical protein H112_08192 [Trichophyton rubrum D6]|uniref:Uncharacterized protein n=3 Tax=Trichophyton TaxID=5550 RepID=F2SD67_TRIRC|nr:uncharacterized protein TERG_00767 [Trichophyton rubrum CBS 118892]EZF10538.1 hypothetical protein H100_08220 [Trichophyton rubrum MR850]EZF37408.1 hypothetical protein H102_08177 [Trichophyton rubrum CBS 100081]EZF48105.1 hypothetical protein H103_08202 [Trichophyton rubrum CBS 288.86]EZF58703.1 hypothetical protein H104_08153 [Trichophyton rubrum CBS 289.86]EZF69362.1 hypothetical protein H105_08205 [Trichophyton soudanense CBS 452.61]EZF79985.1 hypothetical protein H110_08199 [Trichophy
MLITFSSSQYICGKSLALARTGQEHDGKQNKNDVTYNTGETQGRERRGETEFPIRRTLRWASRGSRLSHTSSSYQSNYLLLRRCSIVARTSNSRPKIIRRKRKQTTNYGVRST